MNNCKLCPRLIISDSVTFTAPNLIIDIPAGAYSNCQQYCIVVAQSIPAATTLTAPVFISIGGGTELYPLTCCNGVQATAAGIRSRTKYKTVVHTTADSGTFRLRGNICCYPTDNLTAIDGTAPAAGGDGA